MKITKKVTTVGSSLGILIDKPIIEKLKLNKGDFVELEIKKVK
jgi:antitoxin component of MazEF toxin-antitoxin module